MKPFIPDDPGVKPQAEDTKPRRVLMTVGAILAGSVAIGVWIATGETTGEAVATIATDGCATSRMLIAWSGWWVAGAVSLAFAYLKFFSTNGRRMAELEGQVRADLALLTDLRRRLTNTRNALRSGHPVDTGSDGTLSRELRLLNAALSGREE
jgi:hypothetical protein